MRGIWSGVKRKKNDKPKWNDGKEYVRVEENKSSSVLGKKNWLEAEKKSKHKRTQK